MPEFRLAPAGPGKAVIVAADLRIVLRRAQRNQVELGLVAHMRLETHGRLPAIAGRPTPAVHLPQHVLGHRSAEHTSDLQSLMRISYAVIRMKNNNTNISNT